MVRVPPPQMIGVHDVAEMFGCTPDRIRRRVRARHGPTVTGYFGKVGGRHIWNAHELFGAVFTSDARLDEAVKALTNRNAISVTDAARCGVDNCTATVEIAGLCRTHLRRFMRAWYHASESSLALAQLVGMCRWIVERNAHLVLPSGYDPFDTKCMTPDCEHRTNDAQWHGPLCPECSARFWNNPPAVVPRPYWKQPKRGKAA